MAWSVPLGHAMIDHDPEVIEELVAEGTELLDEVDAAMRALEGDTDAPAHVERIFRAVHTLKGNARFFGFTGLHDLLHATEALLASLADRRVAATREVRAALAHAAKTTRARLRTIADQGGDRADAPAALVAELEALANEGAPAPLGRALIEGGLVKPEDVAAAVDQQRSDPRPLGQILVARGALRPSLLAETLARRPRTAARAPARAEGGVRVDAAEIDELVRLVADLDRARAGARIPDEDERARALDAIDDVARELAELCERVRLAPIGAAWRSLPGVARDVAEACAKEVRVVLSGDGVVLPRAAFDAARDALLHAVRNAVDHGVEAPDDRAAAGKPRAGKIALVARESAEGVVIDVTDDGRGIDLDVVRAAAIARGVVDATRAATMTDAKLLELLFLPGFSTREHASTISGRGIGLDVVRSSVERAGGRAEITTAPGHGTTLRIVFPRAAPGERAA